VYFDGTSFSLYFDGSDVGLGPFRIDAFARIDTDTLLLSFDADRSLTGFGTIDDSDIVQFDGTLGAATSGTFSVFFDGSDVGLTLATEDVDAFELLPTGDLVVSTLGIFDVPGVTFSLLNLGHDMIRCTGPFAGPVSTCTGGWSIYFDGDDVGLGVPVGQILNENVDGVSIVGSNIYLSTVGAFSVPAGTPVVSGADEDVFVCAATATGTTTACTWSATLFFDGSLYGLAGNDLDAIDLP
jgi:hypothetical protein